VPLVFQLPQMVSSKDNKAVTEFAKAAAKTVMPCEEDGSHFDWGGRGGDCSPPPLEDACDGVAARHAITATWRCETKVTGSAKAPPLIACTLSGEYPPGADDAVNAAPGSVTTRTLLRAAFVHEGHLFVADWPKPRLENFQPANELELASCAATNKVAQCERTCDETYHRLSRPDCGMGPDGEGDGPSDEHDDEDPEVRSARLAAEQAEARAAEAEHDAAVAREELEYQRCHTGCTPEQADTAPKTANDTYTFLSSPAPGVLAYKRLLDTPADTAKEVAALLEQADRVPVEEGQKLRAKAEAAAALRDERHFLTLLKFAEYSALAAGEKPDPGATEVHMLALEELASLEDGVLKAPAKDGKRLVYGLGEKAVKSFTLDTAGALAELSVSDACKEIVKDSEASARVKASCKEVTP
jgi:hypothetical protein